MPYSIRAVYQDGVLRPDEPLDLKEGEVVQVIVNKAPPVEMPKGLMTPEQEAYCRRLRAAKTLAEALDVMATAPPDPRTDDYDLCRALNENRKATGERLLYPELENGSCP
jgi:predicted DNA-binding antitoxin AbrB/MazE fold protein